MFRVMVNEMFQVKLAFSSLTPSLSLAACIMFMTVGAASAQRTADPNIGHFYMARQQVSITDDSPVIINRQGGGAQGGGGNGALPGGAMPLPAARWQSFAPPPEAPSLSTSLPKVNKGLPTKGAMPGMGNAGNTGRLASKSKSVKTAATKPSGPVTAGYTPYKKFAVEAPVSTSAGNAANTKVYGDVLHWARQHHN